MKNKVSSVNISSLSKRETTLSILIIGLLFFIFGFVSWVNAILIPYFKIACELTNFQSYLVAFAFYISYFVMSVPSSYLLKSVGFKKGMMVGFWTMAIGAFIFVPAAYLRTYEIFLVGLFTLGAGLAILQTAANPYITVLGPKERAAQRISIMGICNKAAGILAPLLFAAVILRSTDSELFKQIPFMGEAEKNLVLDELIRRVILPYTCVGIILLGLGLFVRYSPLPEIDTEHETGTVAVANSNKTSIFQFPHLILGALGIFLHVGTQVIAIDTIIGYAGSMNIQLMEAKVFPSYTLAATIIGYILGIICIPKFISQVNALRLCTLLGVIFTLLIIYAKGPITFLGTTADISIWFIVLLGFANSLVWAGIWPLALDGLGRFTKIGASIMIMALCGNAIMPLFYGHFADVYDVRQAYWVLFPCYLYLVYYAFSGHKLRSWTMNKSKVASASAGVCVLLFAGCSAKSDKQAAEYPVKLITVAPGHFHAALVQKSMYDEVSPVVNVYAPEGSELNAYLNLIDKYNTQEENPTNWEQSVYKGNDYFEKMLEQKAGNVVVLAGNNKKKTAYIKKSVDAGLNVLSDKPMAIDAQGFDVLLDAFAAAKKNDVLLYDIMTERYEITSILQKELSQQKELFGELEKGTLENPAVTKESVHHFFKHVSGSPLIRPTWYYDVEQEGHGLVDVTTHLVDLIQWECFPDVSLDYKKDIQMIAAKRWTTAITPSQFKISTQSNNYPDFLKKDVKDTVLNVYSNGEMNYTIKGVHAKVSVIWNFQAPDGTGDTHYSIMRGTKANIIIKQGKEQGYKPTLYVEPLSKGGDEESLKNTIKAFQVKYPELSYKKVKSGWEIIIPDNLKQGHEAHFAEVTKKYLGFLKQGNMPEWEVPNMIAKYYTTTQALQKALSDK